MAYHVKRSSRGDEINPLFRLFVTSCPEEVHTTCHATWRLMRLVSAWASLASNSEVAVMFEISDGTVRRYDKIVLESDTPPPLLRTGSVNSSSTRSPFARATDTSRWSSTAKPANSSTSPRAKRRSHWSRFSKNSPRRSAQASWRWVSTVRVLTNLPSRPGCRTQTLFTTASTSLPTSTRPSMKSAEAFAARQTRRKGRF
jgi:hypothetical protein